MDWNPNDPKAVGIEYLPELDRSWTVGSTGGAENGVGQRFPSSVAETIDNVQVFATAVSGAGYMVAEMLGDGDETLANIAITEVPPEQATNVVNFRNQAGSTVPANLIASIDETGDPTGNSDYIQPTTPGSAQQIDLQFVGATIAAAAVGKRVLGVAIGIRSLPSSGTDTTDHYQFKVMDAATGFEHLVLNRHVPADRENWWNLGELWFSADTSVVAAPWNETNLAEFATGGDLKLRIATAGGDGLKISRVRMVLVTCDENRQAIAVLDERKWGDLPAEQLGLVGLWSEPVPLLEPDGAGGSWSKATPALYRMWYRRAILGDSINNLAVTMPVLSRYDSAEPPAATFLDDPLVSTPTTTVGPTAATWPTTLAVSPDGSSSPSGGAIEPVGLLPVRLLDSLAADSIDGQPYSQVFPYPINADDGAQYQLVTTGAGGTYSAVRFPVGTDTAAGPSSDLIVTVLDSTGVTTIATGTLTAAEYRALPSWSGAGALHEVLVDISAVLAAATQYRVRFSSAAADDTDGWRVGVLTVRGAALDADTGQGAATYGGDTDYFDGGIPGEPWEDAAVFLGEAIDGPTDLTATADAVAFDYAAPCGIESVPFALLEWAPSSAGADFDHYRVQRRDSIDDEWADVAYLTAESLAELSDVEVRLGVASEWRVRSEGPDGQASLWADVASLTVDAIGCGYTFSAMALPLDSVAYADVYDNAAERAYDFPDAAEVLVRRFAGRDEFVVFRPLERRSVRFTRRLLVAAMRGTWAGLVGPLAFDALRELCRSAVPPYVCVRDESGNRWFAAVRVTDGSVRQPASLYRANVEVIPTSTAPVPPTITGA